jgi:hypothetical protein
MYIDRYIHTYIHTCMHAYIHACMHTYILYTYIGRSEQGALEGQRL